MVKALEDPLSRTFAALADPTRRAILARLSRGSANVGDLAEPFEMSFAAVSKHLRVLESAGLISRGRDAQYRPAMLDARPLASASAWIDDYRRFWADSFDALDDVLATLTAGHAPTSAADPGSGSAPAAGDGADAAPDGDTPLPRPADRKKDAP